MLVQQFSQLAEDAIRRTVSRVFRRSTLEEELDVGIVIGDNGAGRGHTEQYHSFRGYEEAQLQPSP